MYTQKLISSAIIEAFIVCFVVFTSPLLLLYVYCKPSPPGQFQIILLHYLHQIYIPTLLVFVIFPLCLILQVILTQPITLEFNEETILQRYLFWSQTLNMNSISWIGRTRDNSVLILGNGAIVRWRYPKYGKALKFNEFYNCAMRNCLEANYHPFPITKFQSLLLPVATYWANTTRITIVLNTIFFLMFFCMSDHNWIGAIIILSIIVSSPAWVILPHIALQWTIPCLGDNWEHLEPLLMWSNTIAPKNEIARIIFRYMLKNLEEISISAKGLRSLNFWLLNGYQNLLLRDLLPLLPNIGNRKTLKRLIYLHKLNNKSGGNPVISTEDLAKCITSLTNVLAIGS